MKRLSVAAGFSLIEVVVASAISVAAMGLIWGGVRYLQNTLSQQMRLERVSQVLILTQEITKTVREARRIMSVGPDHLDLEIFNHTDYKILDPKLYDQTKRVRYRFESAGANPQIMREVFSSTAAAAPERSTAYLKNVQLLPPTADDPFFFASYLVGPSTMGVRMGFSFHPPHSKDRWTPIKDEVYVHADW